MPLLDRLDSDVDDFERPLASDAVGGDDGSGDSDTLDATRKTVPDSQLADD